MLHRLRHVFRWTTGQDEFDGYFAQLLTREREGVPTADEAKGDYYRARCYRLPVV